MVKPEIFKIKTALLWMGAALFAIASPMANAAPTVFHVSDETIRVEVPRDWHGMPGLFGMPLMFVGPQVDGSQPTLTVIPMGVSTSQVDPSETRGNEASFKQGREEWLAKTGGISREYFPYQETKIGAPGSAHALGYRYEMAGTEFFEKTWFVDCRGKFFQLQSLMTAQENAKHKQAVEKMISGFVCD